LHQKDKEGVEEEGRKKQAPEEMFFKDREINM
jgi:hypothetical protein